MPIKKTKPKPPSRKGAKVVRETKRPPKKADTPKEAARGVYKLPEFEQYSFFLSLPKKDRTVSFGFHTDGDFAKEFQLHPGTLTDWKSNPDLWEKRDNHLLHFRKYTADILEAVAQRTIKTGDSFHALNYMKMVEDYTERSGLDLTSKGKKVEGFKFVVHKPISGHDKKAKSK